MYNKILVINMLHIGDLLLATPVLTTLRYNYPQAHIALAADAKIDGLVRYNKDIDELIAVDKKGYHNKLGNFLKLIKTIRKRQFDLVINLHPNERASALAAFSGAKKIIGYSSFGFGLFFDHLINNKNFDKKLKNRPDIPHQACEHLEMLKLVLGIEPKDEGLKMEIDEATMAWANERWFAEFGNNKFKVIGFNTGASWPTKRWTTGGFAAVADNLLRQGYGVAFFGGPMDAENVREILSKMEYGQHARLAVFTGQVNLLELAALIRKCAVFLTNDSGPMHVAVAQQAKVVSIWGSSNEVGFAPYSSADVVITAPGISCRPCGQHNCDHHSCMREITADTVLRYVLAAAGASGDAPLPAVFFDRDGVLNFDKGYIYRSEEFEWNDGAIAAIKYLNDAGKYVFVVTNQSGVARGYYREEDVRHLHRWMNEELAKHNAHIDAFYYCPHHENGLQEKYRMRCDCRKPGPGLLLQALSEWQVDRENSFLVGDKDSDIMAAQAAGIKGHLYSAESGSLLEFIQRLLR